MSVSYPESWGADEAGLWAEIGFSHEGDYGNYLSDDRHAMALFDQGWIDEGLSPEDRQTIRDAFFDYAIEEGYFDDRGDFDWDAWREYMGY